jgi:hypothetical protein
MHRCVLVSLVLACSSHPSPPAAAPDAHPLDAPSSPDAPLPPNLACLGQPLPTTAADPLAIAGTVFAASRYDLAPVAAATATVRRRSDDAILATATTANDGSFAAAVASAGHSVDAYVTIAASGDLATRVDPGDPLAGGENVLAVVADDAEVARWYADAGASRAAGEGALVVLVVDCQPKALAGTTIEVAPAPTAIVYFDDTAKRWNPTLTSSSNGYALVIGAASRVTITAHAGAIAFPPRAATAPPAALTLAVAPPR